MKATAELQVIPIGSGVSVRKQIMKVMQVLEGYDLLLEPHASGTNIEGDMTTILRAVEAVHERLHGDGEVRLVSYLKLESRTDKTPTLAGKRL